MKDPKWIVAFPLEEAFLCVNCENVGNRSTSCIVCLSQQLLPIAKILNGHQRQEKEHVDQKAP